MWTIINAAPGVQDSYLDAGFALPKNLMPLDDETILSKAIRSYGSGDSFENTVVVLSQLETKRWNTHKYLDLNFPEITIVLDSGRGRGALSTALLASDKFDSQDSLIVASGDSFIASGSEKYVMELVKSGASAGTVTFPSTHPRWSHVRTDKNDNVMEVTEKNPISDKATTGLFYFKSALGFLESAGWVYRNNVNSNERYYVSQTLNYFILNGDVVKSTSLEADDTFHPMGLPSDYIHYQGGGNAKV